MSFRRSASSFWRSACGYFATNPCFWAIHFDRIPGVHVPHLGPFRHGLRILVVQPVDEQDLGGHLPRSGRACRFDERRDPALVRLRDEIDAKDLRPGGARHQRLDVAVEVIDASIFRLERARQPDGLWHVSGKRNPELVGLGGHHIEGVARNARVNLEQVVARFLLRDDHRDRGVGRLRAVVVERGARRVDARAEDFALRHPLAVDEVPRIAQHAADRGDAIGDVEKQRALDVGLRRLAAGNVRVELAESRHEVLALAVDLHRSGRHLRLPRCGDRRDLPVGDDDGLVGEHRFLVHWQHVHADERCGGPLRNRLVRGRSVQHGYGRDGRQD